MADTKNTSVSSINTDTSSIKPITYNVIQERVQFLYKQLWFNPDAFFPTVFGYANDGNADQDVAAMVKIFDGIENADGDLVTTTSLDDWVKKEDALTNTNLDSYPLAVITKVEGLKIPETPIERSGGRIVAKEKQNDKGQSIKINFLLQDGAGVVTFNKKWQNKWFRYSNKSRVLKAMTGDFLPEGYLGMDYIHILPDGTFERIGHLFIAGLIPTKIEMGRSGLSLGPGGDKNNNVPTATVTYVYAQAMLVLKNGSGSEIIYFE